MLRHFMNCCDMKQGCKWTDVPRLIHKVRCAALGSLRSHKRIAGWLGFPCLKLEYESPMNISAK